MCPRLPTGSPRGTLSWGDLWTREWPVFLPANCLFRLKDHLCAVVLWGREASAVSPLFSDCEDESFLAEASGEQLQPCLWLAPSLGSLSPRHPGHRCDAR